MPGDLLASEEIALLDRALVEWGGPARCSDELVAAEIVFVGDPAGTGCEWPTTTGLDGVVTLPTLRGIQWNPVEAGGRLFARTTGSGRARRDRRDPVVE